MHTHDYTELVVVTGGCGMHIAGQERYPLTIGDVFIIPPGYAHGYSDIHHFEQLVVKYDHEDFLGQFTGLQTLPGYHALFILEPRYRKQHRFQSRLHLEREEFGHVVHLLLSAERELHERQVGYQTMVTALFHQMVVELARRYAQSSSSSSTALLEMGTVIAYLEEHFAQPTTLEQLAEMANRSVNQFIRVFRQATQLSPMEYLIRLRILKAVHLFQQKNATVTEVASRVGFNDSNYFSRQFKRVMGTTPKDYRRCMTGK